jgi:hypothetical protein
MLIIAILYATVARPLQSLTHLRWFIIDSYLFNWRSRNISLALLFFRAKGKGQRAKGKGQRAKGKGQRAKGKGQRAKGIFFKFFVTNLEV